MSELHDRFALVLREFRHEYRWPPLRPAHPQAFRFRGDGQALVRVLQYLRGNRPYVIGGENPGERPAPGFLMR